MPLVSIVTPSYNQADFLEQAIQSVLAQDYAWIEYIVVDGGSTDGSLQILHKYADKFAWWVSEPDAGQADAINKGLRHASGEIVAWLNSDDLYLPGAVGQAVAALQANPRAGLVFGDAVTIDPQGSRLNRLAFGDWGLAELLGFRMICQPAVFMRRARLEQAGFLDPTYHFMLDHHLWLRIARLAPVQHIASTWAAARHHPMAKNVAQAAGFGTETMRLLEWIKAQPDLAALVAQNRRQIEAGAYRLSARYLLDGDQPGPALRSYLHALRLKPAFALKHWHRMLYALLSLAGGRRLAGVYYLLRRILRSASPGGGSSALR
jgi:glycosyltransferase involved in cell wall biosynthesis